MNYNVIYPFPILTAQDNFRNVLKLTLDKIYVREKGAMNDPQKKQDTIGHLQKNGSHVTSTLYQSTCFIDASLFISILEIH